MTPHRGHIPYRLFAVLLVLDVAALLIEKNAALHAMRAAVFYVGLAAQPWLWLSLGLGPIQLWVWTRILARTDLSLAYPISSISYPLTMVAARLAFGEHLSLLTWCGGLLVTVGVSILGSRTAGRAQPSPPVHL